MTTAGIFFLVIFLALIIYIILKIKSNNLALKNQNVSEKKVIKQETVSSDKIFDMKSTNPELAAISLALHLYINFNSHDEESNVITIKRIERRYSPWSSKIYSMNNFQ